MDWTTKGISYCLWRRHIGPSLHKTYDTACTLCELVSSTFISYTSNWYKRVFCFVWFFCRMYSQACTNSPHIHSLGGLYVTYLSSWGLSAILIVTQSTAKDDIGLNLELAIYPFTHSLIHPFISPSSSLYSLASLSIWDTKIPPSPQEKGLGSECFKLCVCEVDTATVLISQRRQGAMEGLMSKPRVS